MLTKLKSILSRWLGAQTLKRVFQAARVNRLTSDWIHASSNANQILRGDLRRLRDRSRDLARNDPYAKKYFRLVRNNVVGRGFTLQVRPSGKTLKTDQDLAKKVEAAFFEWGKKRNCSASGKLSWLQCQELFVKHLSRDGEALVRKIYDKRNKFGFSLKFYPPAWLDEFYNDTLTNGNRVIMSVEVDDFDAPVAYYFTQPAGDYQRRQDRQYRQRIPADQVIHAFLIEEDEEQARGIPWIHASMNRFKQFDGYEEAELVGKRAEACQMAFAIPPADEAAPTTDPEDDEGNETQLIQDMEPGTIGTLPPGYDLKALTPKVDGGANDFKKTTMRGIAAGVDVSYHSLAGDLEAVNYSSAKIGGLEERDNYTNLQSFVIENFCEPVYEAWIEQAFLSQALQISQKEFERVKNPFFRGRGWTWVEPLKEATAAEVALANKLTTRTDILAERGIDIEDHFETLRKEQELAETYKIDLTPPAATVPASERAFALMLHDGERPIDPRKK